MSKQINKGAVATPPGLDSFKVPECSLPDTSGLLQTLQGHIEGVRNLIQCGICVRPLYEPYTLACGHTFCYGCLASWFGSGRSNKTCPDCRAQVKSPPAPAYLVRAIVQMFTSHAELLEKGETTAEHKKHQREEAQRLEADKANNNPRTGGLFQGSFKERVLAGSPIIDLEDNVTRCPVCSWELEDNTCLHCGYPIDESGTGTETDENSEMTDSFDEVEDDSGENDEDISWNNPYDAIPFEQLPFGLQQFYDQRHRFHHRHYHMSRETYEWQFPPSASSATHDDSEEEESDPEGIDSFLDDEQEDDSDMDHSTVVGDNSTMTDTETETSSNVMSHDTGELSDDPDEENPEDEVPVSHATANGHRRPIQNTHANRVGRSGHSLGNERGARQNASNIISGPPHQNRHSPSVQSAGSSTQNAITLDDDSEDDAPVPPRRRLGNRRHRDGSLFWGRRTE